MDPHATDPSARLKGVASKKTERSLQKETRIQILSFILMVFMTSMSFLAIGSDAIPNGFAIPFILLIAFIQVVLQLYFFMHLNGKGTGWMNIMIWSGLLVAGLTVGSLMFLIGVVKY